MLVLDCEAIRAQYRHLRVALPGVDIYFAVKALPHPAVAATLDEEGSSFDVASTGELRVLADLGVAPERLLNTHPIKSKRDIEDALRFGCKTFVVDNAAELEKFVPYRDRVSLLLRLGFRSAHALVHLSKKFGCAPNDAIDLLTLGRHLGLNVNGLSLHVGSQCGSPEAHVDAINACRTIIERVHRASLARIEILDIGGGFPASYVAETPSIEVFCAPIRKALEGLPPDLRVTAEPGRYIAAPSIESITTVVGKAWRENAFWYYLDDGVHGSYNGRIYDPDVRYPLRAVTQGESHEHYASVLAGPSSDDVDIVEDDIHLPELQIGDLIVGSSMGAYTIGSVSEFNSIPKTKVLVLNGPRRARQA